MKRKRFTEQQIHGILKEVESGVALPDVSRKHGIHPNSIHRWRAKYGGMELSDLKKLKALEDENARLKKLVADQALNIQGLQAVLQKKW